MTFARGLLWSLLRGASFQDGLALEVHGWDNPTVRFGDVSFQVGTEARPMVGAKFYESYLGEIYFAELNSGFEGNPYIVTPSRVTRYGPNLYKGGFRQTAITLPNAEPGVYGIAMRLDFDDVSLDQAALASDLHWGGAVLQSVARADAQGQVRFMLPNEPLRLVEAFTAESEPGTAVLVRLSGADFDNGWYEVVSPGHATMR